MGQASWLPLAPPAHPPGQQLPSLSGRSIHSPLRSPVVAVSVKGSWENGSGQLSAHCPYYYCPFSSPILAPYTPQGPLQTARPSISSPDHRSRSLHLGPCPSLPIPQAHQPGWEPDPPPQPFAASLRHREALHWAVQSGLKRWPMGRGG